MKNISFTSRGGFRTYAHLHTRGELGRAWYDENQQGNRQARARGDLCVIIPVEDKEKALKMSALFHQVFAIESCCHWDGKTLSMYCGDAGGGYKHVRLRVEMIPDMLEADMLFHDGYQTLFAEDLVDETELQKTP